MSALYGLVVCGGKSTRMGTDKSMLNYHGQPQNYHLYDMLGNLCERVFISCNKDQATTIPDKYSVIVDALEYEDIGPMAALLSAFDQHAEVDFLVVGCDYPFINTIELQCLIKVSLQYKKCTAFISNESNILEPLLSVYQNNIYSYLQQKFKQKEYSLRIALEEYGAELVKPFKQIAIKSIDTIDEYQKVMMQLYNKNNTM